MPTLFSASNPDCTLHDFFDVADRICELYISSRERFVIMDNGNIFIPKKNGTPLKLANRYVCHHLNHRYAIGIYAGAYSSKFICFDVDDGSRETVFEIISLIESFGIPRKFIHVSTSGGKGFHVEVFFDDVVYTDKLAILYDYVIFTGKLNPRKVEFRPTHTQSIKLPLSVHHKTGNTCWFLNRETLDLYPTPEYIFGIEKFPRDKFNELVAQCGLRNAITEPNNPSIENALNPNSPKTKELTPEIEALIHSSTYPIITGEGQRHTYMRSIAIYNRVHGMTQEDSYEALEAWWREQNKSLTKATDKEALNDAASLIKWTFSDEFTPPRRDRRLVVDDDLIRITLAQRIRFARRIIFLVACFCSSFGCLKMSYERIAAYVGCTALSANNTLKRLEEDGWIEITKGARRLRNGIYYQETNTYRMTNKAKALASTIVKDKAGDTDLFAVELPLEFHAVESEPTDTNEYRKVFVPQLALERFSEFYDEIITTVITDEARKLFLTKSEIALLKKTQETNNPDTDIA